MMTYHMKMTCTNISFLFERSYLNVMVPYYHSDFYMKESY
jgi:hypothetical protein